MNKIDETLESFNELIKEPKVINRIVWLQHSIISFTFKGEHQCRSRVYNRVLILTVGISFNIGEKVTAIHEL